MLFVKKCEKKNNKIVYTQHYVTRPILNASIADNEVFYSTHYSYKRKTTFPLHAS